MQTAAAVNGMRSRARSSRWCTRVRIRVRDQSGSDAVHGGGSCKGCPSIIRSFFLIILSTDRPHSSPPPSRARTDLHRVGHDKCIHTNDLSNYFDSSVGKREQETNQTNRVCTHELRDTAIIDKTGDITKRIYSLSVQKTTALWYFKGLKLRTRVSGFFFTRRKFYSRSTSFVISNLVLWLKNYFVIPRVYETLKWRF